MSRDALRMGRAALFGFRARTSRIRSFRFWRVFYAVLATRLAVRILVLACRLGARVAPGLEPEEVALRLSHLFLTGWPHHMGTPWVNLDVSRCYWRVVRELRGGVAKAQQAPRGETPPLRVGVVANLGGSLIFPHSLFADLPEGVAVSAFDLCDREAGAAGYLEPMLAGYRRLVPSDIAGIAAAIEDAELDLLVLDIYKSDVYGILDRVSTPCVVNLSTTVNLRFHETVSFHLYFLQQADYLIRDNRIFRGTSRSWFGDQLVFPGFQPFDDRGIDPAVRRPWSARKPLLVYHGKLYKLSQPYLECIFGLLREDSELEFVAMGRDSDGALARMEAAAAAYGVASRVRYEGEFRPVRNGAGELDHPSWLRLADYLGEARLAPDPWPLAGGCSRLEAYAAGVPVAHMGIRTDAASWGRPQHAVTADQPALAVPIGTAFTIEEYRDLCRRALYDGAFADALAAQQAQLAVELTDPLAFWRQLLDCYGAWRAGPGSPDASTTGSSRRARGRADGARGR